MLLAAKWLLTGNTPPIKEAAVLVEEGTIRDIGTRAWFAKKDVANIVDLGDAILIPGLINAHCHLEHSAVKIPKTNSFSGWARDLQQISTKLSAQEKKEGIKKGIGELIQGGTTTLVDHRSPETGRIKTPFREQIILETLGTTQERAKDSLKKAREWLANHRDPDRRIQISPHSLYAVHPTVLKEQIISGAPLHSVHLLESEEENDFFRKKSGLLTQFIHERGGFDFPDDSPLKWLKENHGLDEKFLLIHGNYLQEAEIRQLQGTPTFVIHCPGSHAFFKHKPFPFESFFWAGIRIGLGTDGLASNETLSMMKQMKLVKESTNLGEEDILRMATINGAIALGLENDVGTIEVGKKADIVAVPLLNKKVDPYEALLMADHVKFSMVEGQIILNV